MKKLLSEIGFTEEQIALYTELKAYFGNALDEIRDDYLSKKIDMSTALQKSKEALPDIHPYTVELAFVIECLPAMKENHIKNGISEKIFLDSARDLTYKIRECKEATDVFGISVGWWYDRFIFATRLTFSRLQYDVNIHSGDTIEFNGHVIENGDFYLGCHIHSEGPLHEEDCIVSYKEAWEYFRDKAKNGVLPITCVSWLLYPDYMEAFGENSNIGRFARHFHIYRIDRRDDLISTVLARVFNNLPLSDSLPETTSLQRRFKEYFKKSTSFGNGAGVIFFDGEKVLTQR